MLLVKALLTSTSFATGFDGGPLFPLLFIGGTLGLAISQVFPFIPEGVGVTTGMAGLASAVFPIPLTVALLLGLMGGQPDLLPVITVGAVIGLVITHKFARLRESGLLGEFAPHSRGQASIPQASICDRPVMIERPFVSSL